MSSGNYHARPRHFPSGNIWPVHDQKHILVVTNMFAGSSQAQPPGPGLPSSNPPPTSLTPSTEPRSFTAKQMFHLTHKLPGTQPEEKERAPGGALKEAAARDSLRGAEITPWISPSVPPFASQARVCSFLPRDPFLSPINTITALWRPRGPPWCKVCHFPLCRPNDKSTAAPSSSREEERPAAVVRCRLLGAGP